MTKKVRIALKQKNGKTGKVVKKKKVVSKKINKKLAKKPMGKSMKEMHIKQKPIGKKIKGKQTKSVGRSINSKLEEKNVENDDCNSLLEDQMSQEVNDNEDQQDDTRDMSSEGEVGSADGEEVQEDEGYVEPATKDIFKVKTDALEKQRRGMHLVFDDDENFEDLLSHIPMDSVADKVPSNEGDEESDLDAPPEEGTISKGKDAFAEDDLKLKKEIMKLKRQVKETRRLKHEQNREQQRRKRERLQKLEKSRLPEDLLAAVAKEEKKPKKLDTVAPKPKLTTFDEDMFDDQTYIDAADEDDIITLDQGVKVQAIQQQLKKHASLASIASDFRHKALYKKISNRMTSLDQRKMLIKQKKGGKNKLWKE
ncbi:E3 ubiquitin-protein ligase BRE1A-like [Palaemon carinicauda]|uniref:E3 ubiquitin-protein ligase BRE1A-like n=1 Tax=Palaemon carinicauda TaxID=392227 RepID=UPI0035B61F25